MSKKIISIDVGIKNLALCILEIQAEGPGFGIRFWDVINLFEDQCSGGKRETLR